MVSLPANFELSDHGMTTKRKETGDVSSVLETAKPTFSAQDASRIARDVFGLIGTAVELGSERDQTFLIDGGGDEGVLKISNIREDPAFLDFERQAIRRIRDVDPELPVAQLRPTLEEQAAGPEAKLGPTAVSGPEGSHYVRLFDRMHGSNPEASGLSGRALWDYGAMHARLNVALRGFFHPAAGRELLWDLKQATRLRALTHAISDTRRRSIVERVLDRYDANVAPEWDRLRAQVVHADLSLDNVLVDDAGRITGIVDFGDMVHSAEIADVAVAVTSLLRGRAGPDLFRAGRRTVDGYQTRRPLEDVELSLLGDLIAARLVALVVLGAWLVEQHPENADYNQAWDADSWELLEFCDEYGWDAWACEFGAPRRTGDTYELARRRQRVLGPAITSLTYHNPVHLVRGEGVWLFDASGQRLLDAYNNVPVVGHCHPRVSEAVVRQTRALNTHARYLYDSLIELAERLVMSMPAESGLDTVMVMNSGSEANDLAWRIATAWMGRSGGTVTSFAYHGVTDVVTDLSPEIWLGRRLPPNIGRIAPPISGWRPAAEIRRASKELAVRGHEIAATFIDGAFMSDGVFAPDPDAMIELVRATHELGGLFVADEVQAGFGRSGRHLWSFAGYGAIPDIVTLGKPMGNGYPVAALITRRDLAERFAEGTDYFSTFGGNPVAARAALAVLDVIEDEELIDQAAAVGLGLRSALEELGRRHACVGEVRGQGLIAGVELVDAAGDADAALTKRVADGLRDHGVLIGRTGPDSNVLKVRPPLVFDLEHIPVLIDALDAVLWTSVDRPKATGNA